MSGAAEHVAVIMDGNGRWARARGLARTAGHEAGAESARRVIKAAGEMGVKYLTLYAFSEENWRRSPYEVNFLMTLLSTYLQSELAELHANGVKIRVIGNRGKIAGKVIKLIESAEELTKSNAGLNLTIALSYGGRQEITLAAAALATEIAEGKVKAAEIAPEMFSQYLFTADLPEPDLLIRTGGEKRISNFLLWQSAYAELYFTDTLWPDFGAGDLAAALEDFKRRERRYGTAA